MAAFTMPITAVCNTNPKSANGFAGAVLLQGQVVYQHPTNRQMQLARANDPVTTVIAGMVRNGAGAANTPVDVLTEGLIEGLTAIVVGQIYCLAPGLAGGIIAFSELVSGDKISIFGWGVTTTSIQLAIHNTGLAKP